MQGPTSWLCFTVSKESALTEAGNSVLTAKNCISRLAGTVLACSRAYSTLQGNPRRLHHTASAEIGACKSENGDRKRRIRSAYRRIPPLKNMANCVFKLLLIAPSFLIILLKTSSAKVNLEQNLRLTNSLVP